MVLVVLPFLSLSVTLPVAVEAPFGVVIVTLYLPAFLLVGALATAPSTLLALIRVTWSGRRRGRGDRASSDGIGVDVRRPATTVRVPGLGEGEDLVVVRVGQRVVVRARGEDRRA